MGETSKSEKEKLSAQQSLLRVYMNVLGGSGSPGSETRSSAGLIWRMWPSWQTQVNQLEEGMAKKEHSWEEGKQLNSERKEQQNLNSMRKKRNNCMRKNRAKRYNSGFHTKRGGFKCNTTLWGCSRSARSITFIKIITESGWCLEPPNTLKIKLLYLYLTLPRSF